MHAKAGFRALADICADMQPDHTRDDTDHYRFEYAWLMFEVLSVLWDAEPPSLGTLSWPLEARHHMDAMRERFDTVQPELVSWFLQQHAAQHRCERCAVPVVTLDGKYGMACKVCNFRDGGATYVAEVDTYITFGCEEPPVAGSLYCARHQRVQEQSGETPLPTIV